MDIFIYSRSALDAARPHEVPHVVISITSSPDDIARVRPNRFCKGILRLSFADIETPQALFPERVLFSRAHAAQIWAFVDTHHSHIERVLIHCDAGVSRSPAVGAALARDWDVDNADFFAGRYRPNMHVYDTLLAVRRSR